MAKHEAGLICALERNRLLQQLRDVLRGRRTMSAIHYQAMVIRINELSLAMKAAD